MTDFFVGLDLGQASDYTALSILEKEGNRDDVTFNVRFLERTRGTPYPSIVDKVTQILSNPTMQKAVLVVDQTGVGAPVVDMFRKANLNPVGIMIHGGADVTETYPTYKVPKRDLVAVVQVLLQNQRLQIAKGPLRDILVKELLNFKVKIDPETAHDSYSAWREGDHDDLVLAVALASWWCEMHPAPQASEWMPPETPPEGGCPAYDGPF